MKQKALIDLHIHSNASDGTDSPIDLARKAHAAGLKTIALTDHDTCAGLEECENTALSLGLEFIRGCELSSRSEYGAVDVLGLWIPKGDKKLEAFCKASGEMRLARNHIILNKLAALGMPIEEEDLFKIKANSICRTHIARIMKQKGYVKSIKEAFTRFIGDGGPAYTPKETVSPAKAVELIASTGATPIIAHPMLIKASQEELDSLIKSLIPHGLAGLEVYHSEHDARATRRALALAEKYGLVMGGGSDYHGEMKPQIQLGVGKGSLYVPLFVLEKLKQQRQEMGLPL